MRHYKVTVVLCLCVFNTGCGTMANLQGKSVPLLALHGEEPVRVYGGVRNDFKWVERGHGIGFVG